MREKRAERHKGPSGRKGSRHDPFLFFLYFRVGLEREKEKNINNKKLHYDLPLSSALALAIFFLSLSLSRLPAPGVGFCNGLHKITKNGFH